MVRFLITRPIAVIMVYVAAIALGVVSYYYIPVSLMPDIPIPEITVHVSYRIVRHGSSRMPWFAP
jgi:multidrug efflux pump subunit AcrB